MTFIRYCAYLVIKIRLFLNIYSGGIRLVAGISTAHSTWNQLSLAFTFFVFLCSYRQVITLIIALIFSFFAFKASVPFTFNELKYMLKHQYSRKLQVPNNANNNNVMRR